MSAFFLSFVVGSFSEDPGPISIGSTLRIVLGASTTARDLDSISVTEKRKSKKMNAMN